MFGDTYQQVANEKLFNTEDVGEKFNSILKKLFSTIGVIFFFSSLILNEILSTTLGSSPNEIWRFSIFNSKFVMRKFSEDQRHLELPQK